LELKYRGVRVFVLMCLAIATTSSVAQSTAAVGYWEGVLRFRGAEMPVRIHIQTKDDSLVATLDIPSMVMAWEPIPATLTDEGTELALPFGLGALALELKGDEANGARALGENLLELHLEHATAPPFTKQEIQFKSDSTDLAGTLVLPQGKGPHPAVVLLHGSGKQGKQTWEYRSWADLLVRQGLAVLYYDKRGVGASGGEYGVGLRKLADDGVAAVQYLRSRPEVDARRIGLKGSSQGAWLAEQVAADLGDIAFLLLGSAAAGTPKDQEVQKTEYGMRDDGRPETEIEDALAYVGLYFYVARTGEGWPLLEKAVRRAQTEEWGQYVDQPRSVADLAWWHENHAFQPAEAVKELDLPVLLLYGEADWITPPIENAGKLRSLFKSPERVELHIFPGADHRLELDLGKDANGVWQFMRIAPGMHEIVAEWLETQVLNRLESKGLWPLDPRTQPDALSLSPGRTHRE